MRSSKILTTLTTFSRSEWQQFSAYVKSDFANASGRGQALLNWLQFFFPDFDQKTLTHKNAFEAIHPGKPFQSQTLKDEMTHLFRLAKSFLAIKELTSDPIQTEMLALAQLRKRNATAVQKTQLNKVERMLNQQQAKGESHSLLQYQWSNEANLFLDQKKGRSAGDSLQQKIDHLDEWYLYMKLKDSCELLNRQNILQGESHFTLLEEIQQYLQSHPKRFAAFPAIVLYQQVFYTLKQPTEPVHYHKLVALLTHHLDSLSPGEAQSLYRYAQNYCIGKINRGESEYYKEIFTLFQTQLEAGVLNLLPHTTFTNIATAALRLKEFEWVDVFMESYKHKLPAETREDIYTFNRASFFFEKKQYREAVRLLRDIEIQDPFYLASARVLLCKTYFEQKDWEALSYLMDTFGRSLKRNKIISPSNRNHYLNFLKYLKRIARLRERSPFLSHKEQQERSKRIKHILEKIEEVSNLKWLKEQV